MYLPPEYPALLDLDVADQLRLIAVDVLDAGLPDVYVGILVCVADDIDSIGRGHPRALKTVVSAVRPDYEV